MRTERFTATEVTAHLGRRLRAARKAKGLTQNELAYRVGYATGTSITWIEQGTNNVRPDTLVALCREVGVSPNHLLGWSE